MTEFKVGDRVKDKYVSDIKGIITELNGNVAEVYTGRNSYTYKVENLVKTPLTNGEALSACKTNEERAEMLNKFYIYARTGGKSELDWLNKAVEVVE